MARRSTSRVSMCPRSPSRASSRCFPSSWPDTASFLSCLLLPPGFRDTLRLALAQEASRDASHSYRLHIHLDISTRRQKKTKSTLKWAATGLSARETRSSTGTSVVCQPSDDEASVGVDNSMQVHGSSAGCPAAVTGSRLANCPIRCSVCSSPALLTASSALLPCCLPKLPSCQPGLLCFQPRLPGSRPQLPEYWLTSNALLSAPTAPLSVPFLPLSAPPDAVPSAPTAALSKPTATHLTGKPGASQRSPLRVAPGVPWGMGGDSSLYR